MAHRPFEATADFLHEFLPQGKVCPEQARPFVLAATITASALAFIDGTLVGIAIPAMQREFGASLIDLQWVANSYALFLGALILVGGGLGDRIGRRRVFLVGIVVFTAASIACALAPTVDVLIWSRGVQGIGAALLVPQSLALISANFPKEVRGKAIGTWAAASAITTAIGPPIGGFLIDLLSWRAAFWVNLPVAAVAVWLTWVYVEESRDETGTGTIDWQGALVAVLAFGALTFGLTVLSESGGVEAGLWIGAGIVGIAAFVFVESRAGQPLMPLELFRSKIFSGVNLATVFLYGALSGVLFLLPFDLLARRGFSAAEAGLMMLPFGLIIGFASRYTGDLSDKYGLRPFLVGGPIVVGAGCAGLALGGDNIWLFVIAPIVVLSVGMALVVSPLTTAVMSAAPEERAGAASGISNTASRLSGVLAVAIFGATAALVLSQSAPEATFGVIPEVGDAARAPIEAGFTRAYAVALLFAAVWCLLASAVSYFALPGAGPKPKPSGTVPVEG